MSKKSKRYKNALEEIDQEKFYEPTEVIQLVKKIAPVKFDAAIELHVSLKIDPKQSDQILRTSMTLPHGTSKKLKIAVISDSAKAEELKAAGATIVGGEDLIKEIKAKKSLDADVVLSEPTMMRKIAPVAKILGQKGLMPNPKAGTITTDFKKTIEELQAGKVLVRNDEAGSLHQIIGRVSWEDDKLVANLTAYMEIVKKSKPTGVKGAFISTVTICSTMGPGIKVKI